MLQDVVVKIQRFPVQTLLGSWLELGTQYFYEASGELWVENEDAVINIR